MKAERVRIGDVLLLERRTVEVEPTTEYEEIGIRSFGRGIFHKEPVSGASLGAKRVFRIEPGDLVISNVFAWEGAIALASPAEAGKIGSHRFMTFTPKDGRIDTGWATWFFRSETGLALIRSASPGSAGRNRTLAIERFESLDIPLPSLDDQLAIAARIDRVANVVNNDVASRAERSDRGLRALTESLLPAAALQLRERCMERAQLGELGTWSSGGTPEAKRPEYYNGEIPWAVIGDLNDGVVEETSRTITPLGLANSSAKVVPAGAVLVAMYGSIGKLGIAGIDLATNQAIAVCRPDESRVTSDFLFRYLRCVRSHLVELGQGGAQQNISQTLLKGIVIPVPSLSQQRHFASDVDRLLRYQKQVDLLCSRRRGLSGFLIPSTLNETFAGIS